MAANKAKKAKKAKRPKTKKKKPGKGSRGGRPTIEFPADVIDMILLLAGAGNTLGDIATICGVSKSTLERRAADDQHPVHHAIALGTATRHNGLRVMQYHMAPTNATMQIWLGKQELGQRDYHRLEVGGPGGGPVEVAGGDYLELLNLKFREFQRSRRDVEVDLPET